MNAGAEGNIVFLGHRERTLSSHKHKILHSYSLLTVLTVSYIVRRDENVKEMIKYKNAK